MYCWKLKRILDFEDNINDLHISFGRELADSVIYNIRKMEGEIEFNMKNFPTENPKHLDVGFENHSKNYKNEVSEFQFLSIKINESLKEIIVSDADDKALIELSKYNLELLIRAIQKSKKFAYFYDNYLDGKKEIFKDEMIDCKIIIWAGINNNIVYC